MNVLTTTASLGSVTVRETSTETDVYYYSVTMARCYATQAATSALASVYIRTLESKSTLEQTCHRIIWSLLCDPSGRIALLTLFI